MATVVINRKIIITKTIWSFTRSPLAILVESLRWRVLNVYKDFQTSVATFSTSSFTRAGFSAVNLHLVFGVPFAIILSQGPSFTAVYKALHWFRTREHQNMPLHAIAWIICREIR